jgi:hypothetical protein
LSATIEIWSDDQEFLNCRQAATFLGVSETSFYRIRMSQAIPFYKIGKQPKFKIADLINFRESQRTSLSNNARGVQGNDYINSKIRLPGR